MEQVFRGLELERGVGASMWSYQDRLSYRFIAKVAVARNVEPDGSKHQKYSSLSQLIGMSLYLTCKCRLIILSVKLLGTH